MARQGFGCLSPGVKRSSKPPGGIIERLLWGSRLLVLVAVVAGVVLAIVAACLATADVVYFVGNLLRYADPGLGYEARDELRVELVTIIVKILEGYLISAILIVFSLGPLRAVRRQGRRGGGF